MILTHSAFQFYAGLGRIFFGAMLYPAQRVPHIGVRITIGQARLHTVLLILTVLLTFTSDKREGIAAEESPIAIEF